MTPFRAFLRRHRALAALLVAAALCMKVLLPAGVMVASDSKVITIEICADTLGTHLTRQIAVPLTGKSTDRNDAHKDTAPCPFGALAMATLGSADVVLLAAALAFVIALGFAPLALPPLAVPAYLRPPLRAPPAHA